MSVERRLDEVIDQFLDSGKITGTVVLAYLNGEPIFRRADGFADREAGKPLPGEQLLRCQPMTPRYRAHRHAGLIAFRDDLRLLLVAPFPTTTTSSKNLEPTNRPITLGFKDRVPARGLGFEE